MPQPPILKQIYKIHIALYRELNDIHIFLTHTVPLLEESIARYKAMPGKSDKAFPVPGKKGGRGVAKRTPKEIARIFERFASTDLHANMLVACVSRFESMLNDVLRIFLTKYPAKLAVGPKGGESGKGIPISMVLDSSDIQELQRAIANSRLQSVFYSEPKEYLAYFESITGIDLPEKAFLDFVEVKATRDLVIHNDGVVNDLYIKKAGKRARAELGKAIPLDDAYFATAVSQMKTISSEIEKQVRATGA